MKNSGMYDSYDDLVFDTSSVCCRKDNMAASVQDLREWLARKNNGVYSHMAVICDTYDHEDYPIYVPAGQDAREYVSTYIKNTRMTRLMEVYNYSMDLENQLIRGRIVMNY